MTNTIGFVSNDLAKTRSLDGGKLCMTMDHGKRRENKMIKYIIGYHCEEEYHEEEITLLAPAHKGDWIINSGEEWLVFQVVHCAESSTLHVKSGWPIYDDGPFNELVGVYVMGDKGNYLEKTLDELNGDFVIESDNQGFACAISKGGYYLIHLNVGTIRNDEYLQQIVDRLNTHNDQDQRPDEA